MKWFFLKFFFVIFDVAWAKFKKIDKLNSHRSVTNEIWKIGFSFMDQIEAKFFNKHINFSIFERFLTVFALYAYLCLTSKWISSLRKILSILILFKQTLSRHITKIHSHIHTPTNKHTHILKQPNTNAPIKSRHRKKLQYFFGSWALPMVRTVNLCLGWLIW